MGQMTRNEGATIPEHFKDPEEKAGRPGRLRGENAFDMHGKFLDGQMLVAMSSVSEPFERAVIYLCAHSEEGAMGIVINRPAHKVKFPELLVQLEVIAEHDAIRLPGKVNAMQVLKGGPVETQRGFVLHTNDFFIDNSTLPINQGIALTATVDILRAIAGGCGPERAVLALGYAGWGAGQLEEEMQDNVWLNVPADPALIFDRELGSKYERAMRHFGIDLGQLVDPGLSRTSYRH